MMSVILGLVLSLSTALAVECPWANEETIEVQLWTGVVSVNGTPYSARRPQDEDELVAILEACDVKRAGPLVRDWRHATGLAMAGAYLPYVGNFLGFFGVVDSVQLRRELTKAILDAHARARKQMVANPTAAASAIAPEPVALPAKKPAPSKTTPQPPAPPARATLDASDFEDEE